MENNKLQELTQKLYNEGLEKGRSEAERILAEAKAEAAKIVAEAKAEADAIAKAAEAKAEDIAKNAMTEITLAGRQALSKIKSELAEAIIMKSTGEAIGYDDTLNRAFYKALQASGMQVQNYGTVLATIADDDKEEALELIRRFYNLGFNIQATEGTAKFLKSNGIRTHVLKKINQDANEIPDAIRQGHIAYVINTSDPSSSGVTRDGFEIRKYATENNVTMFTSLDTVRVLLDVLEDITITISTIDS